MKLSKKLYMSSFAKLFCAAALVSLASCVQNDDYDIPPIECSVDWKANATLAQIKELNNTDTPFKIEGGKIFEGYVVSSDEYGSFFKSISLQDKLENPTTGLQLELDKANLYLDFPLGSRVVVKADGLYVANVKGTHKVGGTYDSEGTLRVGRLAENQIFEHALASCDKPVEIKPTQFNTITEALKPENLNTLIQINNVQFETVGEDIMYYDENDSRGGATNRYVVDAFGKKLAIRTSKYAKYAKELLPSGSGSITFVLSAYGNLPITASEYQGYIRNTTDVAFDNDRFGPIFEDEFANLNQWTNVNVVGTQEWGIANYGNPKPCARVSGYANGSSTETEAWLVSKTIEVPDNKSITVSFESVKRYEGEDIEVYYSTDYSDDVTTATWVKLDPNLDGNTGSWDSWTGSGALTIEGVTGNLNLAFKYTSGTSGSSTWEIDNVEVLAIK